MFFVMSDALLGPPTEKGRELLATCRAKKFVLASGPRLSGKTLSALYAVCDHAYTVRYANILILTVTQSSGLDSGVWTDLVDAVIPSFGLQVVKGPYIHAISKKPIIEVMNKFNEVVTIQLGSLRDEKDVEKLYKGKRYSMIYVPELSNYKKRKTFDILKDSLRAIGVPDNELVFLADTNPADEGDKSWIYEIWYMLLAATTFDERLKALRNGLALVEFTIADNIYITQEKVDELISSYVHDPDLYARYIEGKWVTASEGAVFARVFKPNIHVIGEAPTANNHEPLIMLPEEGCMKLLSGWDLGPVNAAFAIIEPWQMENEKGKIVTAFKVLDELVLVGEDFDLADFVDAALEKIASWEDLVGSEIEWEHWSDQSAFNFKESMANSYQQKLVYDLSDGKVELRSAGDIQRQNMVRVRVDFWRRLLFQNRLYFNATCRNAIEMNKSMKKGAGNYAAIQKESRHKHSFDSQSYPVSMYCFEEIRATALNRRRPRLAKSSIISVGL